MAYRDKKLTQLKGALLLALIRLVHWLPSSASRFILVTAGRFNYLLNGKATRVVRTNLRLCFPLLNTQQVEQLIKRFLQQNAYLVKELTTAWLADKETIQAKFVAVNQRHLLDDAMASGQPIVLLGLHIGNWEFFWHWVQMNYPAYGLYQAAKFAQLDEILLNARSKLGGKAFAADAKGLMGLLRELKTGGILTLLPDQAPREGAGIYTPFFGYPAYTMTLPHKLFTKSGAKLLFGSCLRTADGQGFEINIEESEFDFNGKSVEEFNLQMNQQFAKMISACPAQYQWSYKRFKRQAQGVKNPYEK